MSAAGFDSSLRRRLFYSHLLAVMLVCVAFGGYFYRSAAQALVSGIGPELMQIGIQVQDALGTDAPDPALRRIVSQSPRVAALALADAETLQPHSSAGQLQGSLQGYLDFSGDAPGVAAIRTRLSGDERGILPARLLIRSGEPGAEMLFVDLRVGELGSRLRVLDLSAALALLVALGAAVVVSRIMAARFLDTIRALNQRCQEMAANIDAGPISMRTDDELQSLLDTFNGLAERLREASAQRESALCSMTEANTRLEQQNEERAEELVRLNAMLRDEVEHRLRAEAMIAEAAVMDPLTGLLNRRGMMELLRRAMEHARSAHRPMVLAVVDVDHFKQVNDHHGHEAGDRVLAAVAARLRAAMHGEDAVARWGGEEFLLLWIDRPLGEARELAERLRCDLAAAELNLRGLRITVSMGLTDLRQADSIDSLLARADRALYHAKDSGRNLVVSTAEFAGRAAGG